jgi:hypothetical protein
MNEEKFLAAVKLVLMGDPYERIDEAIAYWWDHIRHMYVKTLYA